MKNTITFDNRELIDYIKATLPVYLQEVEGLEDMILNYQDNIDRETPIFPCYCFELFSQGAVQKYEDSEQIETATNVLLDLDVFTTDEVLAPLSSREIADIISQRVAQFITEKLGMRILENSRVPNPVEYIFRKKIRATGVYDNETKIFYTK